MLADGFFDLRNLAVEFLRHALDWNERTSDAILVRPGFAALRKT